MTTSTARGIDHLVLAVRDLDGAGTLYARLGFKVGARNRHAWGTENRLVQFDGSFLELVTVADPSLIPEHAPRRFSFGAFVRDFLRRREGLAMLVLVSADAKADAASFAEAGIGDFDPFHFERRGKRPDGTDTQVAFTLAFARDPLAPGVAFFVCQQHFPENFWDAAFQSHPNGAQGIASVAMMAENPTDHHVFVSAFTGKRELHASSLGISAALPRGAIEVLTGQAAHDRWGGAGGDQPPAFIGYGVIVPDMEAQQRRLAAAGIPAALVGERLIIPPSAGLGVAIAFQAPA